MPASARTQAALAAVVLLVAAAPAGAEPDATCRRLRAEARAEAAILYAPRLEAEGARAPAVQEAADPTAEATAGLQARVALALSPIDVLRGRAVERVADAECASDAADHALDDVLAVGARYGELAATRAELAYLDAHLGEVDALVAEAADALTRQRATALEVDELRQRRASLRRRATDLRSTQAVLQALDGPDRAVPDLTSMAATARAAALQVDRRRAEVRELSAWRLDLRGGVAAGQRVDYFAVAELSYSFGERWQKRADRRALSARADELADDDRSPAVRAARLQQAMADSVAILDEELRDLDDELAAVAADTARLDGLDSDAARALRGRATVARIELEARRASVATLAQTRRALVGGRP